MTSDERRADSEAKAVDRAARALSRRPALLRRRWSQVAALLALLAAVVLPSLGRAQDTPPNQAGLVIQHGDGRVVSVCVQFREPSITGVELLDRAGVSYLAQSGGTGAAVCQLDGEGCNYPAEDCFCHCKGVDCLYWAYQRLVEGQWRYSSVGAKSTTVLPGDVYGWAWGSGSVQAGAQPPVLPFDQVCAVAAPLPPTEATTVPATAVVAVLPTEPPSPAPAIIATAVPATLLPSPRPRPTRTALPAATSAPTATVAATAAVAPTASVAVTAAAGLTTEALPTARHAPTTAQPAEASPFPTSHPTATLGPAGGAATTRDQSGGATNYLAFGVLALLLVVGIATAALRRRARR